MDENTVPVERVGAAVLDVEVVAVGPGAVDVSWDLIGEGPVDLAVGGSPARIDHDHPAVRVEGTTTATLRDLGPGHHYVSVAPAGGGSAVVAGPRLVALEGGVNFRDLGGYATQDGGRVRWGLIFRSAALHRLTAADVSTLGRLGLRVVYDLRGDAERDLAPSVLPDEVRNELFPIGGDAAKTKDLTDLILEKKLADVPADFLVRVYEAMAEVAAPTFGGLLTRLADPDGVPALFHCTAGKDRTGLAAALLLSVLGVDEATILDDYELSGAHYTEGQMAKLQLKLEGSGIDVERYRAVFGVPRFALATLLATLRERHGSVGGYLVDAAGVSDEVLPELRSRLTEQAPRRDRRAVPPAPPRVASDE
ncbi:MAG: tyrosine-protein phosphatase [Acidimicrobiales bacterium]